MGNKTSKNTKKKSTAHMIYRIDKINSLIDFFGYDFSKRNKNKCKIIINGNKDKIHDNYSIYNLIEKYGVKEDDETFEVILEAKSIEDMSYMFNSSYNLVKIDLSSFDTQNVTNMSQMFSSCPNLVKIDLSSFDTQNVTNMSQMFSCCRNLIKIYLSSFNTQKVTDMSDMFICCKC